MVISNSNNVAIDTTSYELLGSPLLTPEEDIVPGAFDHKQRPAVPSKHGLWRSAAFIIGVEVAERIAFAGLSANLINFMTDRLGQSTAVAAANVNVWNGVASMLPILGAVIADSYLGKYCTIIVASLLYIMGLALLTLSAILPSLNCLIPKRTIEGMPGCFPDFQIILSFAALYIVALGQAGHEPCVQAFGADQFDGGDPKESQAKTSFFNWSYFGFCLGAMLGSGVLSYVQDNLSWGLGFGIPCIIMVIALVIFLCGSSTYRYIKQGEGQNPFIRIGRVFVLAARNCCSKGFMPAEKEETQTIQSHNRSQQFRFLDRAVLEPDNSESGTACSESEVEEAKALLRLFPIWATSLASAIVASQTSTFFIKQGVTLDRSVGSSFSIPAASLQSVIGICIVIFIPIYDCLVVPTARVLTAKPAGISTLQRIGTGLFISTVGTVVAAIVEKKRLGTALQYGLIDLPNVTVPMSIWWLLPQYALVGIAYAFAMVGLQEFFYDQVPNDLRSAGLSLYLSILGTGNLLSSILVSVVNRTTTRGGKATGWLSDNLNSAHLDNFYWLLAGLNSVGLTLFIYFSRSYIYNKN